MPPRTDIPLEIRLQKEPLSSSRSDCLASIAMRQDAPADVIKTNLTPLRKTYPFENWYAKRPIRREQYGKLSYAYNDTVLFGHASLNQKHIAEDLRETYQNIVQLLNSQHYVLLRAWHYLPQLAEATDYQVFCDARAQAFSTSETNSYCAATVIGTNSDYGVVYFIAARKSGIAVNNPRQTLPHLYPAHYVEPSPMFARATLKQWDNGSHLYISGTAAIVGHKSLHEGDADAQLNEVIRNIKTLLNEAAAIEQGYSKIQLGQLQHIKLYVDKSIAHKIDSLADKRLGDCSHLQIFEGQLCRRDLLVEAEAMAICKHTRDNDA